MAKTINLLPKIAENELKKRVYQKTASVISLVALGITLVVLILVFAVRTLEINNFEGVKQDMANKEASIRTKQTKEVILRTISAKVTQISSILTKSPKYSQYLQDITSLSNNISITDTKISGSSIIVSLVAPNSDLLATFLNNLIDPNLGGKKFKNVELSSLIFSQRDQTYKVSLKMERKP